MKKIYFLKILLMLLLSVSISAALRAQNFNLIDINKIKNSNPHNDQYSTMNMFAELKGVFYFSADDGIHGTELWSSDGTAAGTKLVKDITLGTGSSNPKDIVVSGGKLYFVAYYANVQRLWESDGTEAGTILLTDFNQGKFEPELSYLTDANGTLYFINHFWICDSTYTICNPYNQLWKTDGTEAGTVMVADLNTPEFNYSYDAQNLVNVNGKLFFTVNSSQLCTSDGTAAGTSIIPTGDYPTGYYPSHLTVLNGLLYFSALDETYNGRLWVSDGTASGTHKVNNSNNIYLTTFDNTPFAVKNNVLFFEGATDASGYELSKYNTSDPDANVKLIKDINPGTNSSYPGFITNVKGTLFFTAYGSSGDQELWKSDGTPDGTVLVKDINPGGNNYYYGLINAGGTLMFAHHGDARGTELWKSNGTPEGTVLVKDIFAGASSSNPGYFTYKNGIFLFSAYDGIKGSELWKSDGTEAGTTIVKNINHTSTSTSYPYGFAATANNKVVFSADDGNHGPELWVTDGSDAGTNLVKDLAPGQSGSNPYYFTKFQNKTYFISNGDSGPVLGKTDGTKAGTNPVYKFINLYGYLVGLVTTHKLLYLTLINYTTYQYELWRTDGTTGGTYAIKSDISSYYGLNLAAVGNTLFFTNYDDTYGQELWKTDGTPTGTGLVKDIFPGRDIYNTPYSSSPFSLYNFNGKLYFSAMSPNSSYGPTFWTSDGTDAGTQEVKPIVVGSPYYTPAFAQANAKLFFPALNRVTKGVELFVSDGTAAGTKLVRDIYPGPAASNIYSLISGDTLVYFTADDGKHGYELWKSNGTKEGTRLVKNITPGMNSSNIYNMVNVNDKLFFTANDTLWQSDGTREGTHRINDENLNGVSQINYLTAIGGKIYFSGYTYAAGYELYVGNTSAAAQAIITKALIAPSINDAFAAKLLTNPVKDQLKFTVNVKNQQAAQVMIIDAAGRILTSEKQTLSAGTNMFSYDTKAWTQGMYMIRIVTADGSSSLLKAMK